MPLDFIFNLTNSPTVAFKATLSSRLLKHAVTRLQHLALTRDMLQRDIPDEKVEEEHLNGGKGS